MKTQAIARLKSLQEAGPRTHGGPRDYKDLTPRRGPGGDGDSGLRQPADWDGKVRGITEGTKKALARYLIRVAKRRSVSAKAVVELRKFADELEARSGNPNDAAKAMWPKAWKIVFNYAKKHWQPEEIDKKGWFDLTDEDMFEDILVGTDEMFDTENNDSLQELYDRMRRYL